MTAPRPPELEAAYTHCRAVARREARNFYWSFRVLPRLKSDAMCAVYAFMRQADDLADDESMPLDARRAAMRAWTAAWHASRTGSSSEPLFLALNDTQRQFGIPDALLEELVAGTTMDLHTQPEGTRAVTVPVPPDPAASGATRTLHVYATQEALEAYCYLVASVVGLVCIRIFGYSDPRAETLAIDTGKAFQLTNVLRDVKEDAERGRIYLPETLLAEFDVTPRRLLALTSGAAPVPRELAMLQSFSSRAETLYRSAGELLPLLDRDAQPAMRVLVTIYHRLLQRAERRGGLVFHQRVSVPTAEKLSILGRGVLGSLLKRSA